MILVEQHIIKKSNDAYSVLDDLMFKSKNLYNSALYEVRQHFFISKDDSSVKYKYLNYFATEKLMNQNDWYKSLQAQCAQQVLKQLDQNFKSFFALLRKKKSKDYTERINIPRYLPKDGRYLLKFPSNSLSKKYLEDSIIKIPKTDLKFYSKINDLDKCIKEVRFIPRLGYIMMEIVYEKSELKLKENNGQYLSIDLGINNLATCYDSSNKSSFIINGKPIKSINHFYNKKLAKLKSSLEIKHKKKRSKRTQNLTLKRNNKIKDYFHKATKLIINQAVNQNLNTLVVGYNKGWKQEINLGSRNNQSFVQLPHTQFISMLSYKAQLKGINVLLTEESYTSKCSVIDNEMPKKHDTYMGKRIKRGLFISSSGIKINADLNGAMNILKKVTADKLLNQNLKETLGSKGQVIWPLKLQVS